MKVVLLFKILLREHYNNFLTLDPCSDLGLGMEVEVCTTGTEFSNDADSESLGGRTETMVDFIKAEPVEETLAESPDSSFSSKKGYEDAQQSDKWYSHHPTVIAPPQFEAEKKRFEMNMCMHLQGIPLLTTMSPILKLFSFCLLQAIS